MNKISRRSTLAIAGAAIPAIVAGSIAQASAPSALDGLIDLHREAEARWLAAAEAEGAFAYEDRRRRADEYLAVQRQYNATSDVETKALNAVLAYRCSTMAEVSKKAAYIRKVLEGCCLDGEQAGLLLTSMLNEGAVS